MFAASAVEGSSVAPPSPTPRTSPSAPSVACSRRACRVRPLADRSNPSPGRPLDLTAPVPLDRSRPFAVPLITFKICVQSGKPLPSTLSGWYRGVFAAAAPLAPITACQVAVNGAIERAVTGGTRDPSDAERIGVAMAAGGISSVLYSPSISSSFSSRRWA